MTKDTEDQSTEVGALACAIRNQIQKDLDDIHPNMQMGDFHLKVVRICALLEQFPTKYMTAPRKER